MRRRYYRYRSRRSSSPGSATAAVATLLVLFLFTYRNILSILYLILILGVIAGFLIHDLLYKKTAYYKVTGHSYLSIRRDLGLYGEYLTYKHLQHLEEYGVRFLFNVYIPKENGETSEIDVLMISPKGITVFESKNYSGWIFGGEGQANWYQTLPTGRRKSRKEHFYNPVMQNHGHIKHLSAFLGGSIPMHSIIVFSDRCTLKNVNITSDHIYVVNRRDVTLAVSSAFAETPGDALDADRIAAIYNQLYPFTQVDTAARAQHIANIHKQMVVPPVQSEQRPDATEHETPVPESLPNAAETVDHPAEKTLAPTVETTIDDVPVPSGPQTSKCPRCGGTLILRTASRGANAGNRFYGCSNFPKCRYIHNITDENTESKV